MKHCTWVCVCLWNNIQLVLFPMLDAMDSILMHGKVLASLELLSTECTGLPLFCCCMYMYIDNVLPEVPHTAILPTAVWACRSGLMLLLFLLLHSCRSWPPAPLHLLCHQFCDDKTPVSLTLFLLNSRLFNTVFLLLIP